jgi:Spy/CpxP family protein refolding chaperone
MKRQIVKLVAVGGMAAGMIFAQAQPAQTAPQGHNAQAGPAGQGQKGMWNHRSQAHQRMMAALNLTPDQKTMAKSIFGQAREASKPVRMELRQNREAMAGAIKADNRGQIAKLAAERGNLTAKLATNRADAMAKFYQTLTPAQRAKADEMHAKSQARMREFRNEHRGTRTNSLGE